MWRGLFMIGVLVLTPVVSSAQQPCTTDARQVVTELYQRLLERSFDPDEAMINPLERGETTVRELVRAIVQTPEHQQRFLSGTREAGVTALYRHILARDPDPTGLQLNAKRANAEGYGPVIETLIGSGEYASKYGDYGVPGSNIRYCGPGRSASGSMRNRFARMDWNNDGVIQRSEWTGTRASFQSHDWNGDDVLSGDEVRFGARRAPRAAEDRDYNRDDSFTNWDESTFDQIDRNNDGRVSSREWYYDTQSFVRADRNRDGSLSRSEFLGGDIDDDRGDQFESLDANGNGYVDRREWHGAGEAFDWLDRNNDNLLSRAEVVGSTRRWDQFGALDANRDGRLTPDEWRWSRRSFNQQDVDGDGTLTRREFTSGGGVPTSGR